MLDATLPALLLVSVGAALLGVGLLLRGRQAHRLARARGVPGEVVDEVHGHDGQWLPVVRFTTVEGRQVTGVPRSSSWSGVSRIGRRVQVYPDQDAPERFDALGAGSGRAGSVVMLGALLFLLPGLAGLLLR